jgi:hypothetical protein
VLSLSLSLRLLCACVHLMWRSHHTYYIGKLPLTMYPNTYLKQLPAMGAHTGTAYSMSEGIGRSYRYYKGKPLYAFGTGLSLTTFNISCSPAASDDTTADAGTTATSADAGATAVPPPPFPIYRRVIVTCEVSADRLVSCVSWRLSRACLGK